MQNIGSFEGERKKEKMVSPKHAREFCGDEICFVFPAFRVGVCSGGAGEFGGLIAYPHPTPPQYNDVTGETLGYGNLDSGFKGSRSTDAIC